MSREFVALKETHMVTKTFCALIKALEPCVISKVDDKKPLNLFISVILYGNLNMYVLFIM